MSVSIRGPTDAVAQSTNTLQFSARRLAASLPRTVDSASAESDISDILAGTSSDSHADGQADVGSVSGFDDGEIPEIPPRALLDFWKYGQHLDDLEFEESRHQLRPNTAGEHPESVPSDDADVAATDDVPVDLSSQAESVKNPAPAEFSFPEAPQGRPEAPQPALRLPTKQSAPPEPPPQPDPWTDRPPATTGQHLDYVA